MSIDTIDEEQRNVLRRIYREIEGRPADAQQASGGRLADAEQVPGRRLADAWQSTNGLPSSTDGTPSSTDGLPRSTDRLPSSTKPLEASPVAREALERLLAGREFTVVLKSLPDFAQP